MTRKEAKALLESRRDLIKSDYPEIDDYREALDMAISALEQEPILEKIRAEIADLDDVEYEFEGYYKAISDVLQIIDKYKPESEE